MTERLYYRDSYLLEFRARVSGVSPDRLRVELDRTAFYPTSGGQPNDTGRLDGCRVVDVSGDGGRIVHHLETPWSGASEAAGLIDWPRRFDHMQQHTGQHLLSAVFSELLSLETVSFHLGAESSTIDVAAAKVDSAALRRVEERANALIFENRPVTIAFEEAAAAQGLRKPTVREGEIRIITIAGLDRSACGGTHVRATGEIGSILIRSVEKVRANLRVEFVCGNRAVRSAAADYGVLSQLARHFSASFADLPAAAERRRERLEESEKARNRLAADLAAERGRRAYDETPPDADGIRRISRRVSSITDEVRSEGLSFTNRPGALFLALGESPPAVLLAVSEGSAVPAGEKLKAILAELGGRGGGNARLAQGSLPDAALLDRVRF